MVDSFCVVLTRYDELIAYVLLIDYWSSIPPSSRIFQSYFKHHQGDFDGFCKSEKRLLEDIVKMQCLVFLVVQTAA